MRHIFDQIFGHAKRNAEYIYQSGSKAGPGRSSYSDFNANYEELADTVADTGLGMIFSPRRTLRNLNNRRKGLPLEEGDGFMHKVLHGGKKVGLWAAETGYEAGYQAFKFGGTALKAMGGVEGVGMGAFMFGSSVLGGGIRAAQGMELGARFLLTGGITNAKTPLDAYLPGWQRHGYNDIRKYGLNPRIGKRYVAAQAARGMLSGLEEALNPKIAPPQVFVGAGGQIRHARDMGAHAGYGQQLLGKNSNSSGFSQMSMQQKLMMLDMVI